MSSSTPDGAKLTLYTNRGCPWAHRAHIALNELGIPFEQVIIDLDTPRTPEYLAINPRGLVPALSYNDDIIIESAIVANFLANAYPSHLLPPSNAPGGALQRAKIDLFVDAFITKFQSGLLKLYTAKSDEEINAVIETVTAALVKEVEPKLADANPYFGGSDKLTQAEVLTGSFVLRLLALGKPSAGLYPAHFLENIKSQAPNFYKWAEKVASHPSVTEGSDEATIVEKTKAKLAQLRGAA